MRPRPIRPDTQEQLLESLQRDRIAIPADDVYGRPLVCGAQRIARIGAIELKDNDPLVPTWVPSTYAVLAQNAGSQDRFVLQYVKHDGHCQILPEEIGRAFQQLRRWKDGGEKPPSGLNH